MNENNVNDSVLQNEKEEISSNELIADINREFQPVLNESVFECETESDLHDQKPTEATDDGIQPTRLQKESVELTYDKSLQSQSSTDRDDIRSPTQEIESTEENSSTNVSTIKQVDSTNLDYQQSLCVPYTNDDVDQISILKQTVTTTTTITTECTEFKKNKNDIGHIMISYNHSTKGLCSKIAKNLRDLNYLVWIDQDNISGDILTSMASAVENSYVILMAINEQYYKSRYCRLEAEYSVEQNKTSIPMLMEAGYKAIGWLGLINGSKLHIDFSTFSYDEAFHLLLREIEAVRISLGVDRDDQTNLSTVVENNYSITTMNNSFNFHQNVHEWNCDDVIEWLNREKLEIFQPILRNFTGSTLWQLYKIKLDSPSNYYQTIENLLSPTIHLRLFYNLTFNGALESLFSSVGVKKNY